MKRIRNGLYLMAVILGLFLPMQVIAAGEDTVSLVQEEGRVAIVLEMGNAQQEKISAIAVSLQVDEESREKVKAEFDFDGELSRATKGFLYNESTGVLNIYVASDQSLFNGEILELGYVRVTLKDSGQILPVEISYLDASFQTANEVYGEKKPMVANVPEPVNMQVGEGATYVVSTEILEKWLIQASNCKREDYADASWENLQKAIQEARALLSKSGFSQDEVNAMAQSLRQMIANVGNNAGASGDISGGGNGNPEGSSGSSTSDGGNVDHGLYDESTQLVNDPASAQKITSSVIREGQAGTELVDMSKGAAAAIGGGNRTGSSSEKWTQSQGKVSVVSPENGPASIFIAKSDGDSFGETEGKNQAEVGDGTFDENGESLSGEGQNVAGEEILLDQKNGGAISDVNSKRNRVLIWAGIAVVVIGGLAGGIVLLVKKRGTFDAKMKKKPVRKKKRKKPVRKKPVRKKK